MAHARRTRVPVKGVAAQPVRKILVVPLAQAAAAKRAAAASRAAMKAAVVLAVMKAAVVLAAMKAVAVLAATKPFRPGVPCRVRRASARP